MPLIVCSNSKEKFGKKVISKMSKEERRNRLTKRLTGEKRRNKVHTITCTPTSLQNLLSDTQGRTCFKLNSHY